jgi:hypothetical protein
MHDCSYAGLYEECFVWVLGSRSHRSYGYGRFNTDHHLANLRTGQRRRVAGVAECRIVLVAVIIAMAVDYPVTRRTVCFDAIRFDPQSLVINKRSRRQ